MFELAAATERSSVVRSATWMYASSSILATNGEAPKRWLANSSHAARLSTRPTIDTVRLLKKQFVVEGSSEAKMLDLAKAVTPPVGIFAELSSQEVKAKKEKLVEEHWARKEAHAAKLAAEQKAEAIREEQELAYRASQEIAGNAAARGSQEIAGNAAARGSQIRKRGLPSAALPAPKRSQSEIEQKKDQEITGTIYRRLREIIAEIGKGKGYGVVLELGSPMVLYSDPSDDITDEVLKAFDASS